MGAEEQQEVENRVGFHSHPMLMVQVVVVRLCEGIDGIEDT